MGSSFRRLWQGLSPILALIPFTTAAGFQTPPDGPILEIHRYYDGEGRALVEGAVEIPYSLLTFAPEGENLQAHARVELIVEKTGGEEVYRTEHEIRPIAFNEEMSRSDRVSSIETFAIYTPPGSYTALARVIDLRAADRTTEATTSLVVADERPFFSDLLLSNHVQKDVRVQEGSYLPFLIGTTMFNPNPRGAFYKDAPLVYFYYEVNPDAASSQDGSVELAMTIRAVEGDVVKDLGGRTVTVGEGRNFDLGAFSIGGLAPGAYDLEVRCADCPGNETLRERFEVRTPQAPVAFLEPEAPAGAAAAPAADIRYYAELSPAQVDSVVRVFDVLFTPTQRQLLKTLNTTGKVQFLNRFWDNLDRNATLSNPATPENEAKAMFEQRIAYSNQFFTSSQREGWDSQRGRIYMLFGEPSEKIDRPVEATIGPYVIWNYSSIRHTFVFADFRKDGSYQLIYSTHEDFPGDPQIQSLVDLDTATSSPTFLRTSRGYEKIIEDIRQYRTRTSVQQ